ncbi:MAG: hypothetical protein A2Z16_11775 [Chloroflexi bacterium RBG_16_54_18]|nr:MAG: hypothetical protein A2Z16_11775 [Chloroflexi bacterium RBG_16_54_18]
MNVLKKSLAKTAGRRWIIKACVVMAVVLTTTWIVTAESISEEHDNLSDSIYPSTNWMISQAPVAGDDAGVGFITDEDHYFFTTSVLANDSDPDNDNFFVQDFGTTGTLGIVRRNDGGLDPSFDHDGKVITDLGSDGYTRDVILLPDGKIVLVGYYAGIGYDFAVARYLPDGNLDTSFAGDGSVVTDFGGYDIGISAGNLSSNKLIVAGSLYDYVGLARYNYNGSLDTSFDEDGKVFVSLPDYYSDSIRGMQLQADDKIVIVGTCFSGAGLGILVARFNPEGSLDASFDADGSVCTNLLNGHVWGRSIAIQNDNKILVSGSANTYVAPERNGFMIVRYNTDGSLDNSFSHDGIQFTDVGYSSTGRLGIALAIQADNKIITVGNTEDNLAVGRYNPNGSLDSTFDGDGIVLINSIKSSDVVVQPNGKIVIAGTSGSTGAGYDMALVRFIPNGSLDLDFGHEGTAVINLGDDRGIAAVHGPMGMITIAGTCGGSLALARIFADGSFAYDPNRQFEDYYDGVQALDLFTYTLSDGTLTDTGVVTITIDGKNELFYFPIIYK